MIRAKKLTFKWVLTSDTNYCQVNVFGFESVRCPNRITQIRDQQIVERNALNSLDLLSSWFVPYSQISRQWRD
jgi:hypothetical protein